VSREDGVMLATYQLLLVVSGRCACDGCLHAEQHAELGIYHGRLCECFDCESARAWLETSTLPKSCEGHPPSREGRA
jgi:hypothetical protein